MQKEQEHPNPHEKNPMWKMRRWFGLAALALLAMLAILLCSNSVQVRFTPQEQQLQLLEFRIKNGEQLQSNELDQYCNLLCDVRKICVKDCNDLVASYRESMFRHMKETMQGKTVEMAYVGIVKITGEGIRHTLKGKNLSNPQEKAKNIKFIHSTGELLTILPKLKYKGAETAKNGKCKAVHKFKGKLSGGYIIQVVVKESHSGDFTFYDYRLDKREI